MAHGNSKTDASTLGRFLATLRTPAAATILGLSLLLRGCTLPEGSTVGEIMDAGFWGCTRCRWLPTAEVERTPTGLRAVSPADASGASVATACYSHHRGRRGFWAPTREIESHTLRIWAATTLTADEESAVRAAFCDYLITADDGRWADHVPMISSGDTVQTRVLWSGIIEDFLVACLVVGIAYSLRSAQEWPAMAARRRDHRRWDLAHGRCPSCGYELCGLPGRCCPECGETWLADEVTIVP